ncbi:Phosphatidate cytidylyltransferase, mitochondrial, partial [Neolecta irregularis DAH-3]
LLLPSSSLLPLYPPPPSLLHPPWLVSISLLSISCSLPPPSISHTLPRPTASLTNIPTIPVLFFSLNPSFHPTIYSPYSLQLPLRAFLASPPHLSTSYPYIAAANHVHLPLIKYIITYIYSNHIHHHMHLLYSFTSIYALSQSPSLAYTSPYITPSAYTSAYIIPQYIHFSIHHPPMLHAPLPPSISSLRKVIFSPSRLLFPQPRFSSTNLPPANWDYDSDSSISDIQKFSQLPPNLGYNQHILLENQEFKEELRLIVRQFNAPIRYAYAYGSAVFKQKGYKHTEPPVIDFIFAVSHAQHWHSLNLTQFPRHYSGLGKLGSGAVSFVQDRLGAGVYFNPYVQINGMTIKYGVVSLDRLVDDLLHWDTLYLAGRMHKPIKILRDEPRVRLANHINLISALRVALLLLPENFEERMLFRTIAGLSYMGDPRMWLPAENPNKVENIIAKQLLNFRRLYNPLIDTLPNISYVSPLLANDTEGRTILSQNFDPVPRGNIVRRLPKSFRDRLYYAYQRKFDGAVDPAANPESPRIGTVFDQRIANDPDLPLQVSKTVKATVSLPSTVQSIKGLVTAGTRKSCLYLGEKIKKWRGSG